MKKLMVLALAIGLALGFSSALAQVSADRELLFLLDDEHQFLNIALGTDVASIYAEGGLVETIVAQSGETIIDATAPVRMEEGNRWWEVEFPSNDGVAALY